MRYDVAISFAGEQRVEAEEIAQLLAESGVRVFYDGFSDAELWGKDMAEHLAQIYEKEARYCIILISKAYAAKAWPNWERKAALARSVRQKEEYVLPVRMDDTELPGLLHTVNYLDYGRYQARGIVDVFCGRSGGQRKPTESRLRSPAPRLGSRRFQIVSGGLTSPLFGHVGRPKARS